LNAIDRQPPPLCERPAELAAEILARVGIDPPSARERMQPPHLTMGKGLPGLNSLSFSSEDGTRRIGIGADLYPYLLRYARAATAYLMPSRVGAARPSSYWAGARASVATTLDWLSTPAGGLKISEFPLAERQVRRAAALADFAYRFNVCHEIVHVGLGHEPRRFGDKSLDKHQMTEAQEHEADQVGLMLHFNAVGKASAALESAIYFQHAIGLLDARLGLLSDLVDEYHWKIAHTHPPWLARVFVLPRAAESLRRGSSKNLLKVHGGLSEVDVKIRQTADAQQAETVAAVRALIKAEATIVGREDRGAERAFHRGRAGATAPVEPGKRRGGPTPARAQSARRAAGARSSSRPTLRRSNGWDRRGHGADAAGRLQQFRQMTKAERAKALP
jgi:hypothetical protein